MHKGCVIPVYKAGKTWGHWLRAEVTRLQFLEPSNALGKPVPAPASIGKCSPVSQPIVYAALHTKRSNPCHLPLGPHREPEAAEVGVAVAV